MRNALIPGTLSLSLLIWGALPCSAADAPAAPSDKAEAVEAGLPATKQLLVLMDTDRNGVVSKEEFMHFMSDEFDRLDTNKDGVLDIKELEKLLPSLKHPSRGSPTR